MTKILNKTSEILFNTFLVVTMAWIVSALLVQTFFIYLELTEQNERMQNMVNKVEWKIDGRFKNNPDNIWYEGPVTK
jgi:hypothetical protein